MNTRILVTFAQGLPEEEQFIASHKEYALRHGLYHQTVTHIEFPDSVRAFYKNPYKYGKPYIVRRMLREGYTEVLLMEADVMITNCDKPLPAFKPDTWLCANSCRLWDLQPCICACVLYVRACAESAEFFQTCCDFLEDHKIPDAGPHDERLFHEARKVLGMPKWTFAPGLASYHRGGTHSANVKLWKKGDFAMHFSGLDWPTRTRLVEEIIRNPRPEPKEGISAVVAVKDRTDRLVSTLPSWLAHPLINEVVVVDWSSDESLRRHPGFAALLEAHDKLRLVRVAGMDIFNLGQAYNLGFDRAEYDTILKLDADYQLVRPELVDKLAAHRHNGATDHWYFTGHFKDTLQPQLNGFVFVDARKLRAVKGFREDFAGWGFDDDDLYMRLTKTGMKRHLLGQALDLAVYHVPHPDAERVANYWMADGNLSHELNRVRATMPPLFPPRKYVSVPHKLWNPRVEILEQEGLVSTAELLPPSVFAHIFARWSGRRAYHPPYTPRLWNCGDALIHVAARQLMQQFMLILVDTPEEAEVVFFPGGGSMGPLYPTVQAFRRALFERADKVGAAKVILPQTWSGPDPTADMADYCYTRESMSLDHCPTAWVADDLALGYRGIVYTPPRQPGTGVYLRKDVESRTGANQHKDPAFMCQNHEHYLGLAASHERIVTDRLHFAIAAALTRTPVELRDNSYGKNRAMFAHSLHKWCTWGA